MKSLQRWQKVTIIIVAVVLVLACAGIGIYFALFKGGEPQFITSSEIEGFTRTANYVATDTYNDGATVKTVEINRLFPGEAYEGATFNCLPDASIATFADNKLTFTGATGQIEIGVTVDSKETKLKFEVIDGINVFDFTELTSAVAAKKAVVMQANIDAPFVKDWVCNDDKMKKKESLILYNDFYGNAYKLDATKFLTDKDESQRIKYDASDTFIDVYGQDVDIFNVYMVGMDVELPEGQQAVFEDYADGGTLIGFSGFLDEETNEKIIPTGSVKYCVLEKAHKCLLMHATDILVEGNIIREGSDSCISIRTTDLRTSNITLKNNIVINSQVGGIVMWKTDEITNEDNYVTLNIEGVFDVYNWKNETTAAIMPCTEDLAIPVNKGIRSAIDGTEFDSMLVLKDGHKWVHLGIVVISTAGENHPTINGLDAIGYVSRPFPIPKSLNAIAGKILKTQILIGYEDDSRLSTNASTDVTKEMFDKIWVK